ncbi:hypothetical protein [Francisella uliginis]|uniref:Uncharacterized protein n=1 Tax=Francisella uliginis TaxID=573570 RepID=A0A1L4BRK8_9GAMM|nr:hypothetical protein [Francisella uliginis]API86458.1 hypothetical protein F7310_03430 [Francisella uliginis]
MKEIIIAVISFLGGIFAHKTYVLKVKKKDLSSKQSNKISTIIGSNDSNTIIGTQNNNCINKNDENNV